MNRTSLPNRSARMLALLGIAGMGTVAMADIIENQWADVQSPANGINSFGGNAPIGDFNGDGYDDRMYLHDVDTQSAPDARGAVQWGGATGLDAADVDASNTLTMVKAFNVGDLDGDGTDDLIGAFGTTTARDGAVRATRVIFNDATGIGWSQGATTASRPTFTGLSSAVFGDQYTATGAATSGDFDGDGFLDVVMASKVGKHWATGLKAWVWYSEADGSGPNFSSASTLQASDQNINSVRSEFGHTMVSADFNDDGFDDLAVGAHVANYTNWPNTGPGAVYVYYGSGSGLTQASQVKLQLAAPEVGDFYGRAVAAGDVTGDGVPDLISISQMRGSNTTTCSTLTIHEGGNATRFSASDRTELEYCDSRLNWVHVAEVTGDGIDDIVLTTGGSPVIIPGSTTGITLDDAFATCGAAGIILPGDFDGDGYDDLVSSTGVQWINGLDAIDSDCDGVADVVNTDGNGVCDSTDMVDTDLDGAADDCDAFPVDPAEWDDTDGDGVGDNGDAFPSDPTETVDSDGDGLGDNGDQCPNEYADGAEDIDNDGCLDILEDLALTAETSHIRWYDTKVGKKRVNGVRETFDENKSHARFHGTMELTGGLLAPDFRDASDNGLASIQVTMGASNPVTVYDSGDLLMDVYDQCTASTSDNREKWKHYDRYENEYGAKPYSHERATLRWRNSMRYRSWQEAGYPAMSEEDNLGRIHSKAISVDESRVRVRWNRKTELPLTVALNGVTLVTIEDNGDNTYTVDSAYDSETVFRGNGTERTRVIDVLYPDNLTEGDELIWYSGTDQTGTELYDQTLEENAASTSNTDSVWYNAGGRFHLRVPIGDDIVDGNLSEATDAAEQVATVSITVGDTSVPGSAVTGEVTYSGYVVTDGHWRIAETDEDQSDGGTQGGSGGSSSGQGGNQAGTTCQTNASDDPEP